MSSYGFQNNKMKSPQDIETMIANAVNAAVNNLQTQINNLANKFYPVGTILYTTNNTNPGAYLGGTWESYGSGRVLVGYNPNDGDFNSIGRTGGNKSNTYALSGSVQSHTLNINEIPAHDHTSQVKMVDDPKPKYLQTLPGFSQTGGDYTVPVVDFTGTSGNLVSGYASKGGGAGHTHGFTANSQNISTVQPYQVVRIWRRTA